MKSWTIGKTPDCDLVVDQPTVSGCHCRLTQDRDGYLLEDLQSTNGTFVNGQRVTEPVRVSRNDRITLGVAQAMPWPTDADQDAGRQRGLRQPTVAAGPELITIGREPDNDVVLNYPMVSGHHARLHIAGQEMTLEDLGSTNGTHIGSPSNKITSASITSTDIAYFGSFRIPVARLLEKSPASRKQDAGPLQIGQQPVVLGRDPGCDRVLDDPMVSWRHARITRLADGFRVEDIGSTNGTFVNGQRISGPVNVKPGDVVVLGSCVLTLMPAGDFEQRDYRGDVTVEARDLSISVPQKKLLDGVSLTIYPSEFVGLMGPSGAGKSTLMNALNGYVAPSEGAVFLSGQNLYEDYDQFRGQIGYVPQDDIMHSDLTVGQALYYTARLRLPGDFSEAEIKKLISKVLQQLGLQGTEDVLIGSPEKKGISGGQRKRVNLAMELLTDPSVLFLDEPTSGLSSEDALMVMKVLRELADNGKTILLTIHQPSLEAFRQMDNLVMVAKDPGSSEPGQLAYYGTAYPDAVDFFNPDGVPDQQPGVDPSPDEVLRGLAKRPSAEWARRYQQSDYCRRFVNDRRGAGATNGAKSPQPQVKRSLGVQQALTLLRRCVTIKLKDTWNTALLMIQAPIIATLIALVFGKEAAAKADAENWMSVAGAMSTTVFLLALSALWFGCSNSAREIVAEWAIYRRERMVNLKIPSYVASKLAVLGALCTIQCLVLLVIVHWGAGLQGPWLKMFGILWLASLVGVGIGLTVSALARTSEFAIAMLPIIILPMVILGGTLQPVHRMSRASQVLADFMPSRWSFEALLLLEADERPLWQPPAAPELPTVHHEGSAPAAPQTVKAGATESQPNGEPGSGDASAEPATGGAEDRDTEPRDMAEEFFPVADERMGVRADVMVLGMMWLGLVGAIGAILSLRDIH